MLLVIISRELTPDQEKLPVSTLRTYKKAIGWTLDDIQGISPLCMHRITLEEGAKPTRQPQCQLNLIMKEAVIKEIIKLYEEGIIYPVTNSN